MTEQRNEEYRRMTFTDRLSYLQSHVLDNDTTDLSESFLLEALAEEKEPALQWFLVKGVGILRLPRGIPAIVGLCRAPEHDWPGPSVSDGRKSLHGICAWSLGRIGAEAYDSVTDLMNDSDPETRRSAVDALGEIGDKRAVPRLCAALEGDEHKVQVWAALSLAKMGHVALPCLERLAEAPDPTVRLIASDTIAMIERKEFVGR